MNGIGSDAPVQITDVSIELAICRRPDHEQRCVPSSILSCDGRVYQQPIDDRVVDEEHEVELAVSSHVERENLALGPEDSIPWDTERESSIGNRERRDEIGEIGATWGQPVVDSCANCLIGSTHSLLHDQRIWSAIVVNVLQIKVMRCPTRRHSELRYCKRKISF